MTTRVWTIAGCVLGVAATIMLTVLITLAYGVGVPAGPRFTTAAVVTGLLGLGSINVLTGSAVVRAVERRGDRYVQGVQDTVDRLAEALPKSGPVRRIS